MALSGKEDPVEGTRPQRIPYWRLLVDQGAVTSEIIEYPYVGKGTQDEPYIVEWIPDDPRNPMLLSSSVKWGYTVVVAFATFAVSLSSSAYTGSIKEVMKSFGIIEEVATLGVALFVIGFALGPLIWAPLSELVGRQIVFFFTFFALAAFCAGGAGAQNSWSLIILRFFAGSFGSSPLTNAGGVIADIFTADKRGLAMSLFAGAPFLGELLSHWPTVEALADLCRPDAWSRHRWLFRPKCRLAMGSGLHGNLQWPHLGNWESDRP